MACVRAERVELERVAVLSTHWHSTLTPPVRLGVTCHGVATHPGQNSRVCCSTIEVDDGDDDGATTCCKGDRCFRDAYAATAASLVLSGACAAALAKRTRPLYSAAAAAGQAEY